MLVFSHYGLLNTLIRNIRKQQYEIAIKQIKTKMIYKNPIIIIFYFKKLIVFPEENKKLSKNVLFTN